MHSVLHLCIKHAKQIVIISSIKKGEISEVKENRLAVCSHVSASIQMTVITTKSTVIEFQMAPLIKSLAENISRSEGEEERKKEGKL